MEHKIQKEQAYHIISYPFRLLMVLNPNITKILINISKQDSNANSKEKTRKQK